MDFSLFSSLLFGFLIGFSHAFEADHIAAVATIISQKNNLKRVIKDGLIWGMGHSIMLLLAGISIIFFRITLFETLQSLIEFIIGLMIILLALAGIIKISQKEFHMPYHIHYHSHRGIIHSHFHTHSRYKHQHFTKPFIVGIFHGLAGSGALVLLVLTSFSSIYAGLIYIILFGLGSTLGMSLIACLIGHSIIKKTHKSLDKFLRISVNLFALAVGINMALNNLNVIT